MPSAETIATLSRRWRVAERRVVHAKVVNLTDSGEDRVVYIVEKWHTQVTEDSCSLICGVQHEEKDCEMVDQLDPTGPPWKRDETLRILRSGSVLLRQ